MNRYVGQWVKLMTPEHEIIHGVIVKITGDKYWVWAEHRELFENVKESDFIW